MNRLILVMLSLMCSATLGWAQNPSSASKVAIDSTTIFSVGCIGSPILSEDFSAGIPAGWEVWDLDSLTPASALGLAPGWQAITDYRDSTDQAVGSPSWYVPPGPSEDWIVTPPVVLDGPTCISWEIYSQDPLVNEQYEVRIGPATGDTSVFFDMAPIYTDSATSGTPGVYSVVLDGFSGDTLRFAFRQFSDDDFVLILDDVHITTILDRDASVISLDSLNPEALDSIEISGVIANAGNDTLETVILEYSVDGGTVRSQTISDLGLPPFKACNFSHSSLWVPDTLGNFEICSWTRLPNGLADQQASNDTTCLTEMVTAFVGVEDRHEAFELTVYPNPAKDYLVISGSGKVGKIDKIRIMDISGRLVSEVHQTELPHTINLSSLPSGLYLLEIKMAGKGFFHRRLLIE